MHSPNVKLLNELDEIAARCEGTPTSLSSINDEEFEDLRRYAGHDLKYTNEKRRTSSEVLASLPGFDSFTKTSAHLLDAKLWLRGGSLNEKIESINSNRNTPKDKEGGNCDGKNLNSMLSDCDEGIRSTRSQIGKDEEVKTGTSPLIPTIFVPEQNLLHTDTTLCSRKYISTSSTSALNAVPEEGKMLPVQDLFENNQLNIENNYLEYNITSYLLEETKIAEREALEQQIACDIKRMELKEKREHQASKERLHYLNMTRSAKIIQKRIKEHIKRKARKRLNEYKLVVSKISIVYEKITLTLSFKCWLSHYNSFCLASQVVQRVVRSYFQRREANRQLFTSNIKAFVYQYTLRCSYSKWKKFHLLSVNKERDSSAIVIQCAVRTHLAKTALQVSLSAALTIETFLRKENAKMRYRNAQNAKRKKNFSIIIQQTYRGHRLRKRMRGARCNDYSYVDLELEQILGSGAEVLLGDILADEPSPWVPELPKSQPHRICDSETITSDPIEACSDRKAAVSRNASIYRKQPKLDITLEKTTSSLHNKENRSDYCHEDKSTSQSNILMKEWNLNDERVVQVNDTIYFTIIFILQSTH